MRLRILLFPLLLLSSLLSYGRQVVVREIKEQAPLNKSYEYVFPHIVYQADKGVAAKINDALVADFLRIDPKEVHKSIFEEVWPQTKDAMPSLNDIDWTVHTNTSRLLSLAISAEGCGAYCEYFTSYYSFDLKTGKLLTLDQLFTKAGLLLLSDSVSVLKKQKLEPAIKTLQASLQDTSQSKEDIEIAKETIVMYQDCLGNVSADTLQEVHSFYLPFYLRNGYLFIHVNRCSAHYNRSLDEFGDFEFSFKCADLKQYLTPYGQQLLRQ